MNEPSLTLNGKALQVSEMFRSIQGEGPSAGETAVFVRLANCNLKCTWCDTPYSWDWAAFDRTGNTETLTPTLAAQRICDLAAGTARLAVITGGEPMLQQPALSNTLSLIHEANPRIRFEVETNGTVLPSPSLSETVHRYVVSPKLSNAGGSQSSRIRYDVLRAYTDLPRTSLKFVVSGPDDFTELRTILTSLTIPNNQVWVMPEAQDAATLLRISELIAPQVIRHGFCLSPRLHILLWGAQRGR